MQFDLCAVPQTFRVFPSYRLAGGFGVLESILFALAELKGSCDEPSIRKTAGAMFAAFQPAIFAASAMGTLNAPWRSACRLSIPSLSGAQGGGESWKIESEFDAFSCFTGDPDLDAAALLVVEEDVEAVQQEAPQRQHLSDIRHVEVDAVAICKSKQPHHGLPHQIKAFDQRLPKR